MTWNLPFVEIEHSTFETLKTLKVLSSFDVNILF